MHCDRWETGDGSCDVALRSGVGAVGLENLCRTNNRNARFRSHTSPSLPLARLTTMDLTASSCTSSDDDADGAVVAVRRRWHRQRATSPAQGPSATPSGGRPYSSNSEVILLSDSDSSDFQQPLLARAPPQLAPARAAVGFPSQSNNYEQRISSDRAFEAQPRRTGLLIDALRRLPARTRPAAAVASLFADTLDLCDGSSTSLPGSAERLPDAEHAERRHLPLASAPATADSREHLEAETGAIADSEADAQSGVQKSDARPRKRDASSALASDACKQIHRAPWWLRFAPRSLADVGLALHKKKLEELRQTLGTALGAIPCGSGPRPKLVVLLGPSGCGKSAAARVVAESFCAGVSGWTDDGWSRSTAPRNPDVGTRGPQRNGGWRGGFAMDDEPSGDRRPWQHVSGAVADFAAFLASAGRAPALALVQAGRAGSVPQQSRGGLGAAHGTHARPRRSQLLLLEELPDAPAAASASALSAALLHHLRTGVHPAVLVLSTGSSPHDPPSQAAASRILGSAVAEHPRTVFVTVPAVPPGRMRGCLNRVATLAALAGSAGRALAGAVAAAVDASHGDLRHAIAVLELAALGSAPHRERVSSVARGRRKRPRPDIASNARAAGGVAPSRDEAADSLRVVGRILNATRLNLPPSSAGRSTKDRAGKPKHDLVRCAAECAFDPQTLLCFLSDGYPSYIRPDDQAPVLLSSSISPSAASLTLGAGSADASDPAQWTRFTPRGAMEPRLLQHQWAMAAVAASTACDAKAVVGGAASAAAVADSFSVADILTRSAGTAPTGQSFRRDGSRLSAADVATGTAVMALASSAGLISRATGLSLRHVRRPVSLDAGRAASETAQWLRSRQITLGFDLDRPLPLLTPDAPGTPDTQALVSGHSGWSDGREARQGGDAATLRSRLAAQYGAELASTMHLVCERRSVALDRVPMFARIVASVASHPPGASPAVVAGHLVPHHRPRLTPESDIDDSDADGSGALPPASRPGGLAAAGSEEEAEEEAWLALAAAAEGELPAPASAAAGEPSTQAANGAADEVEWLQLAAAAEAAVASAAPPPLALTSEAPSAATVSPAPPLAPHATALAAVSLRSASLVLAIGAAFASTGPGSADARVFASPTSGSSSRLDRVPRSVEERARRVARELARAGCPFPAAHGCGVAGLLTQAAACPPLAALAAVALPIGKVRRV